MIHFRCENCGRAVHVEEAYAGRKGRCPLCSSVVTIPGRPCGPPDLAALAGALQGRESQGLDVRVPPPPAVAPGPGDANDPDRDQLAPIQKNPSDETVILPARREAPQRPSGPTDEPEREPFDERIARHEDRIGLHNSVVRIALLVLALLVVVAAAVGIFLLATD